MALIDKNRVRENFGQGASTYDRYARVQKTMARELMDKITGTGKNFRDILEIGCGTGFLTELLAEKFPRARILAVDISPQMIEAARKKLVLYPEITYLEADGENLSVNGSFDLVVSSAVFQWFNNYLRPFNTYSRILKDDGYFIFNTFGEETLKELVQVLEFLGMHIPRKYFISTGELSCVLKNCRFKELTVDERFLRDYYPATRELLIGIKKIGAQSHYLGANDYSLGPGDIFKLINCYDRMYNQDNQVYATYHILTGLACKGSSGI